MRVRMFSLNINRTQLQIPQVIYANFFSQNKQKNEILIFEILQRKQNRLEEKDVLGFWRSRMVSKHKLAKLSLEHCNARFDANRDDGLRNSTILKALKQVH